MYFCFKSFTITIWESEFARDQGFAFDMAELPTLKLAFEEAYRYIDEAACLEIRDDKGNTLFCFESDDELIRAEEILEA